MVFQPFDRFIFGSLAVVGKSRSICHDTKVTLGQANDRTQKIMRWLILLTIKCSCLQMKYSVAVAGCSFHLVNFCKNVNVLINSKCLCHNEYVGTRWSISNLLFFVLSRLWHPVTVIRLIQKANKCLNTELSTQMLSCPFYYHFSR